MNSANSLTSLKKVIFETVDGLFAILVSILYWVGAALLAARVIEVQIIGRYELIGMLLMPVLFILAHIWHRTGVSSDKRLHLPSIIAVSAFAFITPIVRFGGI